MSELAQPSVDPNQRRRTAFGQYEIVREIAAGGMATVYLARKRSTHGRIEWVAVKCCHPHLRRDPAFVTMFLDEARLAAKLDHPNVVKTIEIGDGDALYFAMQYIEGTNLADWIKHTSRLARRIDEHLLLRIMLDALNGLHAAHELRDIAGKPLNLIHRDVSPQNLLIGRDGVTRIADFGIAKAETRATRTRTGQVKGKTGYMAPEQILGEPIDRRSDVYAAGVVLWEGLTGQRLFDADSDAAIINKVLNAQVAAPSALADSPACLDAIVRCALQYKPADRYATALDFAAALEQSGLTLASYAEVGRSLEVWLKAPPGLDIKHDDGAAAPIELALRKRRWLAIGLMALAGAATWLGVSRLHRHPIEPDTTLQPTAQSVVDVSASAAAAPVSAEPQPKATLSPPPPEATTAPRLKSAHPSVHPRAEPSQRTSAPLAPATATAAASVATPGLAKTRPSEFRPPDL